MLYGRLQLVCNVQSSIDLMLNILKEHPLWNGDFDGPVVLPMRDDAGNFGIVKSCLNKFHVLPSQL